MNKIKSNIRKTVDVINIPNIAINHNKEAELIHCAHCIYPFNKPYIVDVEHYWTFFATSKAAYSTIGKNIIKKILKKDNCKKIIPWTYAAKETIIDALKDKEIEDKIEVVYPAVPPQDFKKSKNEVPHILFIGRYFYQKGGLYVLETFKELSKKYDIKLTMISKVPREIKKKYNLENIEYYDYVTEEKLFKEIYPKSDIFLYPGFSDTFGFAMLEAMSFGIPIITVDGFARREIVDDGNTGHIIPRTKHINHYNFKKNQKVIQDLFNAVRSIMNKKHTLNIMSKNAINKVKKGNFAINTRNNRLKKILEESI